MKKTAFTAIITFLFLPAGLSAMSRTGAVHTSHPVLVDVSGEIAVKGSGESHWEPVERGSLLLSGDTVRTGTGSRADIRFSSGRMELHENTEVRIPNTGDMERKKDIRELMVKRGCVLLDVSVDEGVGDFTFEADNLRGKTTGSILTISHRGSGTAVNLYQGEVRVSHGDLNGERTSSLVPGSSLRVKEGKSRFVRFDHQLDVNSYNKAIIKGLDPVTGLPGEERTIYSSHEGSEKPWDSPASKDRIRTMVSLDREPAAGKVEGDTGVNQPDVDTSTIDSVSDATLESLPWQQPPAR